MGFLKKLMKNPIVQMALPVALGYAAGPLFGALGKGSGLFANMSPLMANALKQSALGYGTAALTGAKDPAKAAMYAGLTSIPFSYMSAAKQANMFNEASSDFQNLEPFTSTKTTQAPLFSKDSLSGVPVDVYNPQQTIQNSVTRFNKIASPQVTPMEILTGQIDGKSLPQIYQPTDLSDPEGIISNFDPYTGEVLDQATSFKAFDQAPMDLDANIFTKRNPIKATATGELIGGDLATDYVPTLVSQGAGLLGEYIDTQEERNEENWRKNKERRKKELAFMYGVDPDIIEGEMYNPYYTGAMFNAGGIASLESGGAVDGPGGPKDDLIDAKLSDGEFVMTAKAVENFGNGDRYQGAKKMYQMMNYLDPESEQMSEVM